MKKRDVPSTSAIGAMVSMFQKGMPPFLRIRTRSTHAQPRCDKARAHHTACNCL